MISLASVWLVYALSPASGVVIPVPYPDVATCRAAGEAGIGSRRTASWRPGEFRDEPACSYACVPAPPPGESHPPMPPRTDEPAAEPEPARPPAPAGKNIPLPPVRPRE